MLNTAEARYRKSIAIISLHYEYPIMYCLYYFHFTNVIVINSFETFRIPYFNRYSYIKEFI